MKRLLIFLLFTSKIFSQQYTNIKPPINYPTPSSVWEFSKYGSIPVNEYRGLANITIPIYNISVDDVTIPLNVDYNSAGIRVSDEASIVGLGWSFNLPTIIQQIKDVEDYSINTIHQKLPPFQGNPSIPTTEIYQSNYGTPGNLWNTNINQFVGTPGIQNIPYFANVCNGVLIDHNGYYNINYKYLNMIHNSSIVDTEPDLFTLNLNGVELKFSRTNTQIETYDVNYNELLPLEILNGRNEFKVELITNNINPAYQLRMQGIKVTDPGGNIFIFNVIERAFVGGTLTQNIFKLSKIITNKNNEINFDYFEKVRTIGVDKYSCSYVRRTGDIQVTTQHSFDFICKKFTNINQNYFVNDNLFFVTGSGDNPLSPPSDYEHQETYFLKNITTPNEKIEFILGNRIDFYNMKKIEQIKIFNILNDEVKSFTFDYDYFDSDSVITQGYNLQTHTTFPEYNIGLSDRFSKRLKLISIQESGNNPYLFEYDTTLLPKKNSFSIDYWGFYNGHNNQNLYPDLTDLGYPDYDENIQNNFNSNINFAKACSLNKIIYPTKGYTILEYEEHQFDNLIYSYLNNPPIINHGAGLRIKKLINYNHDNSQIGLKSFEYVGGKCIAKRVFTMTGYFDSFECTAGDSHDAPIITCTINNFVSNSSDLESQYIGYDKVIVRDNDINERGYIQKEFFNKTLDLIFCPGNVFTKVEYYDRFGCFNNGKQINEKIINANNEILIQKSMRYKIFNGPLKYAMNKQSNGVRICSSDVGHTELTGSQYNKCDGFNSMSHNVILLTFYPYRYSSSVLEFENSTEKLGNQYKTTLTSYEYDNYKNLVNKKTTFRPSNETYEELFSYTYLFDQFYVNKNQFNLLNDKSTKLNNQLVKYQKNIYEINNASASLKETFESYNSINSNSDNRLFIDLYDTENNIVQYHYKNDIKTSVIWGYNSTLPIVKIVNIEYNQIPISIINNIKNSSNSGDIIALEQYINQLYSILPNTCVITSFLHVPMVGISKIIAPNQIKETYEFDGVSKRLIKVFDNEGNLTKEFFYNFKQ